MANGRKLHLSLGFNPRHMEFVEAVVLGRVRTHQDRSDDRDRRKVLSVLIHGEATFCRQRRRPGNAQSQPARQLSVGGMLPIAVNN
jgi:2-oxoglutarate dehydrogenase E1 component